MKIGILGGGQLGRMSILAGRAMGHAFRIFDPSEKACAAPVADVAIHAPYDDVDALHRFADGLDVATLEFENIPASACEIVREHCPLRPRAEVLTIVQHRLREKTYLFDHGFPCAPFAVATDTASLSEAVAEVGVPCVAKTAAFGYDGKGQVVLRTPEDALDVFERLGQPDAVVVEKWIAHRGEFSVVCARRPNGDLRTFPIAENIHRHHILHATIFPGRVAPALAARAEALAKRLAVELDVVGLFAVELFLTEDDEWLVNEIAPRPHNSGHATIDACATSQFEQHVRAVADLPLGSTDVLRPAVMINLLGDLWQTKTPDFAALLADDTLKLHLYDKGEPRVGRKMGHFTVLDEDVEAALARAEDHFARLSG